jgi:hypothetical protein
MTVFLDLFIQLSKAESIAKTAIDKERGKILKPDQYSVYFNEGFYVGKTNRYGFYWPDFAGQKNEETYRIALAGDSYIAGTQLFEKYHFRTLMEKKLTKLTGKTVEVLNFGRAGFDFDDSYCLYKKFISEFSPDLVLIFAAPKDFENDNKDPLLPSCRPDSLGGIIIETDFENKKSYRQYKRIEFLASNSAILKMVSNCRKYFEKGETPNILFGKLYAPFKTGRAGINVDTVEKDFSLSVLNRSIFGDLKNSRVVFVSRIPFPDKIIESLRENGIEIFPLFSALKNMESEGLDPYFWKVTGKRGHWNHSAHERVADFLSQEVFHKNIKSGRTNGSE